MHDLDLDLQSWPRSNVNITIESQYATSYVLAMTMSVLSITVYELVTFKICMTLTFTFRMGLGQMKTPIESQ